MLESDVHVVLTLHGSDVGALDVVLELGNALLELIERDKFVLDDKGDLELLDTVTDGNKLACTPDETRLLDGTDRLLKLGHVRLIIPRLDLEGDNRLSIESQRRIPDSHTYMQERGDTCDVGQVM